MKWVKTKGRCLPVSLTADIADIADTEMVIIRELLKQTAVTAIHSLAGVGVGLSLWMKTMFETMVLPDVRYCLMLNGQDQDCCAAKWALSQYHVIVTGNSIVQENFGQLLEVVVGGPERQRKKWVLLAKLGMKNGCS
jgi:hypothetical protein